MYQQKWAAIPEEETVQKQGGDQPVSDGASWEVFSFISDTKVSISVPNLAALLRLTKHFLPYDSKTGIMITMKPIGAGGKITERNYSFCYLLIIFNRLWSSLFLFWCISS